MKTNRGILIVLIILAMAAGAIGWQRLTLVRDWWEVSTGSSGSRPSVQRLRERLTEEQFAILRGSAADYLKLADKYPDRPWYAWKWFLAHTRDTGLPGRDNSGKPLREQGEKEQKVLADFESNLQALRPRDPDNGYAPMLLAYVEARKGITFDKRDEKTGAQIGNVVDPEHADKAARLLEEAASKERIAHYGRNLASEWMAILGEPRTYEESFVAVEQLAGIPIMYLLLPRELADRMIIEARRLMALHGSADAAMKVLRNVQTIGAKMCLDAPTLIDAMIGVAIVSLASEDGAQALKEAGYRDEAAELLARGRTLVRPRLLASLMRKGNLDSLSEDDLGFIRLENDPGLLEEAKRLLALREKNLAGMPHPFDAQNGMADDLDRAGFLAGMGIPNFNSTLPWTEPPVSRDDLVVTSKGEAWFIQKLSLYASASLMALILAALSILFAVHSLVHRATASAWPTIRQTVVALALFGAIAALPGLAAAGAGNFLWKESGLFLSWQIFWNAFGLAAAGWALLFWIRSQNNSATGRTASSLSHFQWIALSGLVVAIPCALAGYTERLDEPFRWYWNLWSVWKYGKIWLLASAMLLPMPLWGIAALFRWMRSLLNRHASGASLTPSLRLLLMGWAGGVLLYVSSYCIIDWREAAWAGRDTIFLPHADNPSFSAFEAKITKYYRDHVKAVLDSE